jgi:hypothetical protein
MKRKNLLHDSVCLVGEKNKNTEINACIWTNVNLNISIDFRISISLFSFSLLPLPSTPVMQEHPHKGIFTVNMNYANSPT